MIQRLNMEHCQPSHQLTECARHYSPGPPHWRPSSGATLPGCDWKQVRAPSVLIVAVEQLGFNAFSCGEEGAEEGEGGYALFCAEAVRFTHAYAPSPMSNRPSRRF